MIQFDIADNVKQLVARKLQQATLVMCTAGRIVGKIPVRYFHLAKYCRIYLSHAATVHQLEVQKSESNQLEMKNLLDSMTRCLLSLTSMLLLFSVLSQCRLLISLVGRPPTSPLLLRETTEDLRLTYPVSVTSDDPSYPFSLWCSYSGQR